MRRNTNNYTTQSVRSCGRCVGFTRAKRRCTRNTCKYGPMCWQHTRNKYGVNVKKSRIDNGGLGLFAHKDLAANRFIPYKGKRISTARYDQMFPDDYTMEYAVDDSMANVTIDASKTNSTVARYANDGRNRRRNNAELANADVDGDGEDDGVFLRTTRNIRAGEEILTDYGDDYWTGQKAPAWLNKRHRRWLLSS